MSQPEMVIGPDGSKRWYLNDNLHREDGPAVEWSSGSKSWYLHHKLHREDGPAIEEPNGTKEWYLHGERHREMDRLLKNLTEESIGISTMKKSLGNKFIVKQRRLKLSCEFLLPP